MDKIILFIKKEISSNQEIKKEKLGIIHRYKIDIEIIDKKINMMSVESDNTHDVFISTMNKSSFENLEIESLKKEKELLKQQIMGLEKDIVQIDDKLEELNSLLSDSDNKSEIDTIGILEIQEKERKRIASDIHDSVVQNMTALIHKSEFVMKVMDNDVPRAKLELEVINKVTRECIDELRGIIYNLRPMSIDDLGLEKTLRRIISRFDSRTDMKINFNCDINDDVQMKDVITITIVRIVQELCTNSIKYSQGSQIDVSIYMKNGYVIIKHSDDGIGFDFSNNFNIDTLSGFGMAMMRERIALLEGKMKFINDDLSKGVNCEITIPLKARREKI